MAASDGVSPSSEMTYIVSGGALNSTNPNSSPQGGGAEPARTRPPSKSATGGTDTMGHGGCAATSTNGWAWGHC